MLLPSKKPCSLTRGGHFVASRDVSIILLYINMRTFFYRLCGYLLGDTLHFFFKHLFYFY